MREKLKPLDGQRLRFTATVERFGEKPAYKGAPIKTLLLRDVTHAGEVLTDHLWFTAGKWTEQIQIGDTISFDARVGTYTKGYRGYREDVYDSPIETDYRLTHPTKLKIETPANLQPTLFELETI